MTPSNPGSEFCTGWVTSLWILPLSMVSSHLLFCMILCAEANNVRDFCAPEAQTYRRPQLCHLTPAMKVPGFSCFLILSPGTLHLASPWPLEKDAGGKYLFQTEARKMSPPPKQWYDFIWDNESLPSHFSLFPWLSGSSKKISVQLKVTPSVYISPLHLTSDSSYFSIHVLVVLLNLHH